MDSFLVRYKGKNYEVLVDIEDGDRIREVLNCPQPERRADGRKNPWKKRTRSLCYVPAWKNRGFRPAIWTGGKLQYLSRWLLGVTDPKVIVDHIDQNPLNNTRANLRAVDRRENSYNSGKHGWDRPTKTSQYRGVSWNPQNNSWQAKIYLPDGKTKSSFHKNEEDAAKARDAMVLEFLKRNDCLNFSKENPDGNQNLL